MKYPHPDDSYFDEHPVNYYLIIFLLICSIISVILFALIDNHNQKENTPETPGTTSPVISRSFNLVDPGSNCMLVSRFFYQYPPKFLTMHMEPTTDPTNNPRNYPKITRNKIFTAVFFSCNPVVGSKFFSTFIFSLT